MEIKFEKTGDARGVIEVNITEADYASKVDKQLKDYGKTHVIPGFRKGHISLPELRKRFGRAVKSDVINDVVFHGVYDYIRENKVRVLGQPLPDSSTEIDLKQTDYTFKYDVAVAPELNIVLDKSVKLPFFTIEVTDQMIDDQDKQLCERFGTQGPGEEADERALIKGTIMELAEDGTVRTDEEAIQVIDGIVAPFLFKDKEQAAKFLGKHVGDKVIFNPAAASENNAAELASMLNIDKDKAENVKADFEIAISEIIVAKPAEHNQDFYDQVFGPDKVHNEEEYRNTLRDGIAASLMPNSMSLFNEDARDYLVDEYGNNMPLDADLLKRWLKTADDKLTDENIDEEFEKMIPGIKWEIISGQIAQQLGVKVEDADLMARASFFAQQQLQRYGMYNADEETVKDIARRMLSDKNISRQIENDCFDLKMFAMMRDAITLENKQVTLEEFAKLATPQAEQESAEQTDSEE